MAKEQKPSFKNIVLQDEDGTVHVFEPGAKGVSVILLVLKEEEGNMARVMIRSAYTLRAGATLVDEFIKANPNLIPALLGILAEEVTREGRPVK